MGKIRLKGIKFDKGKYKVVKSHNNNVINVYDKEKIIYKQTQIIKYKASYLQRLILKRDNIELVENKHYYKIKTYNWTKYIYVEDKIILKVVKQFEDYYCYHEENANINYSFFNNGKIQVNYKIPSNRKSEHDHIKNKFLLQMIGYEPYEYYNFSEVIDEYDYLKWLFNKYKIIEEEIKKVMNKDKLLEDNKALKTNLDIKVKKNFFQRLFIFLKDIVLL
ncbi:MAG: hypothetical protein R3Y05_02115 [bacterium]